MELGWILSALMAFMLLAYGSTKVTIIGDGCGSKKLCKPEPAVCDPAGTTECWFGSVAYKDVSAGKNLLHIQVRGKPSDTTGYAALGLKMDAEDKVSVFVCTPGVTGTASKAATVSVYSKTVASTDTVVNLVNEDKLFTMTAGEFEVDKDAVSNVIRCRFNATMDKDVSKIAIFLGTGDAVPGPVTVTMGLTAVDSVPTDVDSVPGAGAGLFPSHVFTLPMAVLTVFIMNRA